MKVVIGIDVGGSTTKIVGFDESKKLIEPMFVRANDQMTSIYGAFGKFLEENNLSLDNIEKVRVTGVGATYLNKGIYGLKCESVSEFKCISTGGLYLSGLDRAIVVSLGTGTACVHSTRCGAAEYLGGTAVGGGTLVGLARLLLGMEDIDHICDLAKDGDLNNVDLRIKHITKKKLMDYMPGEFTVSNFGNLSDIATKSDIALGIINMVFESVGTTAVFASKKHDIKEIVLLGNLTVIPQAKGIFGNIGEMLGAKIIIPKYSQFGTVIGAALSEKCE